MTKTKTGNQPLKNILKVAIFAILIVCCCLVYFFVVKGAPITKGNVLYQISYQEDKALDIYLPTQQKYDKAPVILFLHGGGWIAGRKESINFARFNTAVNTLRDEGYAFVCPEYTLASRGSSPFPQCIIDVFDVVKWIERNADDYQLDLTNFGLFGESAGAHLALMAALAPAEEFGMEPFSSEFSFLIDVYGPYDLMSLYHAETTDSLLSLIDRLPAIVREKFDITKNLFGFDPKEDIGKTEDFLVQFSPSSYLNYHVPEMLIIHGDDDALVPFSQSARLANEVRSMNKKTELHILEKVNHAFFGASDNQMKQTQEWIINFVRKHHRSLNPS